MRDRERASATARVASDALNVRYWHLADMNKDAFNVAFGGKADITIARELSAYADPKRTLLFLSMRTTFSTRTVVSIATAIFRLRARRLPGNDDTRLAHMLFDQRK